jgi:hypothetical protein
MGKVLDHGPVPHPEGFFPDRMACDVVPAVGLMQGNDLAGEVHERILPTVAAWYVGAVNSSETSWQGEAMQFGDHKAVVIHELVVVSAVAYVSLVGAVDVETSERGAVDGEVDAFGRESAHNFDAVAVVDGVMVGDDSHDGRVMVVVS